MRSQKEKLKAIDKFISKYPPEEVFFWDDNPDISFQIDYDPTILRASIVDSGLRELKKFQIDISAIDDGGQFTREEVEYLDVPLVEEINDAVMKTAINAAYGITRRQVMPNLREINNKFVSLGKQLTTGNYVTKLNLSSGSPDVPLSILGEVYQIQKNGELLPVNQKFTLEADVKDLIEKYKDEPEKLREEIKKTSRDVMQKIVNNKSKKIPIKVISTAEKRSILDKI